MRKLNEMQPMNSNERFMYEMIVRQNIIIEQLSSIVEHIAKKDGVAVEKGQVQTEPEQIVDEVMAGVDKEFEQIKEAIKPAPKRTRKRTVKE